MKIIFRLLLLVAVMAGLVFGYYWLMQKYALPPEETALEERMVEWRKASQRGEEITVEGRLVRDDSGYKLVLNDRSRVDVRSNSLSLSSYIEKKVALWGEVQGEVLVVNKIQELGSE
jgi:hypothetical protein